MIVSELKPSELRPVLAKIHHQTDLGLSKWCEVVYYDEGRECAWKSYSGSKTFEDGEKVVEWVYADDAFRLQAEKTELFEFVKRAANCTDHGEACFLPDEAEELLNKVGE